MKKNLPVTDVEYSLTERDSVVSKTDLKGIITYINEDFLRISGFTQQELIGSSHNIVRHPDMPPEAFEDMWRSLKAGRPWTGIVKNRCKNGDFYWVLANATPIHENDQLIGYMSVRSKPSYE
ncbi:MAG: PAS domain-containing protein, partial [Methylobacter sp.]